MRVAQWIETRPFRGADQTVAVIRRAALDSQQHYLVRLLAEEIANDLRSKDYLSEILATYYYLLGHARYMNDPRTIELVREARNVIRRMYAGRRPSLDCDDMVAFLAALMLMLGRHVWVVTVAFAHRFHKGKRQYQHVFLMVQEPRTGIRIVLDPVAAEDTDEMLRRAVHAKIWPIA